MWNNLKYMISILFRNPRILFLELYYKIIYKNWKKIQIHIDWKNIFLPNTNNAFNSIHNIFTYNLYKKLSWCNNVLDLWWFIWESAVYLSKFNRHITVYEPNQSNFDYVKANCSWSSFTLFNNWITWIKNNNIWYFLWDDLSDSGLISYKKEEWKKILLSFIEDVLHDNSFDWIKIDIEWTEYELCEYFYHNINKFIFDKWYIEFHRFQIDENQKIFHKFYNIIKEKYNVTFEDVYGKIINYNDAKLYDMFVLFFEKNSNA